MDLEFEWDEEKRLGNITKHKIDFFRARELFDGRPVFSAESGYADEARTLTTGVLDGAFVTAVWTQRNTRVRFISVRRARDAEERAYRSVHRTGD
jgi:uncharacterized protein